MLIVACQEHAADVVKRTISEARTKPRLNVEIRLEGNDFPTHDELALRQKLESEIERQHIGAVLDSGSGRVLRIGRGQRHRDGCRCMDVAGRIETRAAVQKVVSQSADQRVIVVSSQKRSANGCSERIVQLQNVVAIEPENCHSGHDGDGDSRVHSSARIKNAD